jgi:hypothetical protein
VVTDAQIDDDITIAPTTFEDNPIDDLPPPPSDGWSGSFGPADLHAVHDVRPRSEHRPGSGSRALEREYPALLRDAGSVERC